MPKMESTYGGKIHDFLEKREEWPGGYRYDYQKYYVVAEREFTTEEMLIAFHENRRLEKLWVRGYQTWKDKDGKLWGIWEWTRPASDHDYGDYFGRTGRPANAMG